MSSMPQEGGRETGRETEGKGKERRSGARGWEGVLSIFVQRGCAVFQGIVFASFSRTGYQKKANFLEQVVKTCQKRKFCYNGLSFSQIFAFLSILFTDFF